MAAKDVMLPSWLRKSSDSLKPEGKVKLVELHKMYKFGEDQLECFNLNANGLTMDNLEEFVYFLKEEAAKTSKKTTKTTPVAPPVVANLGKRVYANKRALPSGIGAVLGLSQAAAPVKNQSRAEEVSTPPPKKLKQEAEEILVPARGTPDPPSKVSVKSSVNKQLVKPEPNDTAAKIQVLGDSALWLGTRNGQPGGAYRWMDEAIEDRAAAQDAQLALMQGPMLAAVRARPAARLSLGEGEEEVAAGTIGVASQAEVALCGRLVCEGLEGRLNERSIILAGPRTSSNVARVHLNLGSCPNIAAFPGQIVGVLGRSGTSGSTFHARDFVAGLPPPMPVAALRADAQMHLMVAAGPFCLRDGLDYTPLEQVFAHAARMKPRVLLLLGPLLDAGNLKVSSGDAVLPGEVEPRPFEEVYTELLLPMLARCIAPLRRAKPPTEVLIVSSLEEALCFHPLPQPPLDASLSLEPRSFSTLHSLGVKFLPNPAHLDINGLKVTASSTDALSPVLRELVLRPPERKIEEALRLLLKQRSMFPVVPRDPAQVCEARAAALNFPFADGALPDVCIFPSAAGGATGTFVDGTAFVNPGLLCRGTLGTFAEVMVLPDSSRAAQGGAPLKLSERARVDILKLDGC